MSVEIRNCGIWKCLVFSLFVTIFLLQDAHCQTEKKPADRQDKFIAMVNKAYRVKAWKGKTKEQYETLDRTGMDAKFFSKFSKKTTIHTKKSERDKILSLRIQDIASDLPVKIKVHTAESPSAAHEMMIKNMALATAPLPVYQQADPNDPNDPMNIGDVCFYPVTSWVPKQYGEPVLRELRFCRNNLFVHLQNFTGEDSPKYPDLQNVALLMDEKILDISKPKKQDKVLQSSSD